jgi:hypothetical protein
VGSTRYVRFGRSGSDACGDTDGTDWRGAWRLQARWDELRRGGELLGKSERHFRCLRDRHEQDGAEGLIDRRRGRASGRRAPVDTIEWVLEQFWTRYFDFTTKHFHEALRAEAPEFNLSYAWTETLLQQRGLIGIARSRSAYRKKRVRRPLPG